MFAEWYTNLSDSALGGNPLSMVAAAVLSPVMVPAIITADAITCGTTSTSSGSADATKREVIRTAQECHRRELNSLKELYRLDDNMVSFICGRVPCSELEAIRKIHKFMNTGDVIKRNKVKSLCASAIE